VPHSQIDGWNAIPLNIAYKLISLDSCNLEICKYLLLIASNVRQFSMETHLLALWFFKLFCFNIIVFLSRDDHKKGFTVRCELPLVFRVTVFSRNLVASHIFKFNVAPDLHYIIEVVVLVAVLKSWAPEIVNIKLNGVHKFNNATSINFIEGIKRCFNYISIQSNTIISFTFFFCSFFIIIKANK
jgi:hypothetical protein